MAELPISPRRLPPLPLKKSPMLPIPAKVGSPKTLPLPAKVGSPKTIPLPAKVGSSILPLPAKVTPSLPVRTASPPVSPRSPRKLALPTKVKTAKKSDVWNLYYSSEAPKVLQYYVSKEGRPNDVLMASDIKDPKHLTSGLYVHAIVEKKTHKLASEFFGKKKEVETYFKDEGYDNNYKIDKFSIKIFVPMHH